MGTLLPEQAETLPSAVAGRRMGTNASGAQHSRVWDDGVVMQLQTKWRSRKGLVRCAGPLELIHSQRALSSLYIFPFLSPITSMVDLQ